MSARVNPAIRWWIPDIRQRHCLTVRLADTQFGRGVQFWWLLPDGNLMALFRDNRGSGYLYRSFSIDNGLSWSKPTRSNFPDATSKINGLRLRDGRYVLVSNANPEERDPLVISVSDEGMVFRSMGHLFGGRRIDYPHVLEHEDHLLVAFSGGKQSVEVLKICTADLGAAVNGNNP